MRNLLLSLFILISGFISSQCTYSVWLRDTYGDGWNGGYLQVFINGVYTYGNYTLSSGSGPAIYNFNVFQGQSISVRYYPGSWSSENYYRVYAGPNATGALLVATPTYQTPPIWTYPANQCSSPLQTQPPSSISASSNTSCPNQTVTLTANNSVGTTYWFTTGCTTVGQIATGATINVNPSTTTTYYARNYANGIWSSSCAQTTITVNSNVQSPNAMTYNVNCGVSPTLTAVGGPGNYQWWSNSNGTGLITSGQTYNPGTITSNSTFYVTAASGASGNYTQQSNIASTFNTPGSVTTLVSSTPANATGNGTLTVFIRGDIDNSTEWVNVIGESGSLGNVWGGSQCSGAYTTSTYTIPAATINSWAANGSIQVSFNSSSSVNNICGWGAFQAYFTLTYPYSGGCNSQPTAYTVNVIPLTQPTANNTSVNCGSSTTLSITNAASNVNWYTNSNGTGQVGSGSTFTTPQLTSSTTYYVGSGSGACATPLTPVTVSVNNNLAQPTSNNTSINCGQTSTLTASGGTGTYAWYSNSNATGQLGTGVNFTTPQLTTNTTYYVTSTSGSATTQSVGFNNCYAINNWSLQHLNGGNGSVNTTGSPNSIQLTGPNGTGGNSYTLYQITVAATGTISWSWTVSHNDCSYDTYGYRINGTDYPLATCNASGSTSVNVTAGQTFAFYGRSHDGCCGTFTATISNFNKPCSGQACFSQPVAVQVTVNPLTAPVVNNTSINCGSTATINASGNGTITWYQNSNLTGTLGTGNQWTTPTLTTSTTYYLQSTNGSCQSSSAPVTVTVNPLAAPTVTGNSIVCIGNSTTLTASGGNNIVWYSNSNGTGQLGTGSTYTTPQLNNNTTYYVGSQSQPQTQTATFNINSIGQLVNMNSNCGSGSYYNGCSGTTGFNWNSSLPAGATIVSVQIQLSVGVECQAGTRTTTLNNINGPTFNTINHCSCSGGVNPIFTLNMNPVNYIANGTNQFRITNPPSCFGLFSNSAGLPGNFARVIVTYTIGSACSSSLSAFPITISNTTQFNQQAMPIMQQPTMAITQHPSGQYAHWYNGFQNDQYIATSSISTDYLTVRFGQPQGALVSQGTQPVSFNGPSTGSYYIHVNTNGNCGNDNQLRTITVSRVSALPIELLSFDGTCNDNIITLNWKTATEHNSQYFEILKSRDGENWSQLTTVASAGNSTQELSYETGDNNAIDGNNYYKLIQYDIDGQFKEYGPINVVCSGNSKGYFSVFPNPTTGQFSVIINKKSMIGSGKLLVKDSRGSVIISKEVQISNGINLFNVDEKLSSGVYYITIESETMTTEAIKEVIR